MALAQIGSITAAIEAFATAVGAGIVLGGFVAGVRGLVGKLAGQELQAKTLNAGYVGGVLGMTAAVIDSILRYVV